MCTQSEPLELLNCFNQIKEELECWERLPYQSEEVQYVRKQLHWVYVHLDSASEYYNQGDYATTAELLAMCSDILRIWNDYYTILSEVLYKIGEDYV